MVRCGGLQKAAAEKKLSKKENPVSAPPAEHAAPSGNDLPTTIVVEETSPAAGANQTAHEGRDVFKRKEVPNPDNDKAVKKPRIKMAARKKSGGAEISRVELHGAGEPNVLTLYAGETIVPSPTEKAVEEIKEEVREFIPQVHINLYWPIVNGVLNNKPNVITIDTGIEAGQ